MSIKNYSYTIGNRNRDLPTCSAVHQPTAPPRAPYTDTYVYYITISVASYANYFIILFTLSLQKTCLRHTAVPWNKVGMPLTSFRVAVYREDAAVTSGLRQSQRLVGFAPCAYQPTHATGLSHLPCCLHNYTARTAAAIPAASIGL
jgi:hypothetical protein